MEKAEKGLQYDDFPDFLTIEELKQYLRIGTNKAYELARRQSFPKVMFGNKKIFPKAQVREWMLSEAAKNSSAGQSRKIRAL